MRSWRIVAVLLLCLVLASSTACNPFGGDQEGVEQQLVEVVRGDLTISVSGSGNIEVSNEVNLAFGVGGRIDRIYVNEGNNVTGGDVLAKLDTDALELALTQAQVALTKAEVAVTTANVTLRTAKHSLDEARDIYTWPEIKVAQADVDAAEDYADYVLDRGDLPEATLVYAQARLTAAEAKLDAMIMSYDTEEVAIKKMEVELAEQSLELKQQSLEQIKQSLEQARKNLNEATLTAPFDGVVASVYADEGDTVLTTTVIIHLIDLTTMELQVEVDEIDIPGVEVGQRVIIEVDALLDLPFEGEVTFISSLAKEEAGVVLYEVTISFGAPEGSGLRVGMSTTADIVIDERSNVLLVPDRAIKQDSEGNSVVEVMVGKEVQERPAVIGISDGLDTEIVDGLNEGEVVVERRAKPKPTGMGCALAE